MASTFEAVAGAIRVQQLGLGFQVVQPNRPVDLFNSLDLAIAHAVKHFRERRAERLHVLILPPDSPYMWD